MRKSVYAIDIGSSNVKIYRSGEGVVLSEPSVVAVSSGEKRVVKAVGLDAKKIIGKTAENTFIVCPISEGGVTNERMAVEMLSAFLKKAWQRNYILGLCETGLLKLNRLFLRTVEVGVPRAA